MDPAPRRRRILGPLALVAAVAAGAGWWLFRDRDERAVVTAMRWSHTTQLERWTDVTRSDWRDALVFTPGVPPVGGAGEVPAVSVGACKPRFHHEETRPCGTETVVRREAYRCGTERRCETVRRGSGEHRRRVRECTDVPRQCHRDVPEARTRLCTEAVTADWCEYLTQEWHPVRSERIEGDAHLGMRFAPLEPGSDYERILTSGTYSITFDHAGGQHTAVVERAEYDRWNLGDPAVLRLETASGVLGFERPGPPSR
jgi:hypothetical protein